MADRLVGLVWPGPDLHGAPIPALLLGSWQPRGCASSHAIETWMERQRMTVCRGRKRQGSGRQGKAIRRASDAAAPSIEYVAVDHRYTASSRPPLLSCL